MAVERADLSLGFSVERMAPVPAAPALQGQSPPEDRDRDKNKDKDKEDKPRHRPPPTPEGPSAKLAEEDNDPPTHRIDSLA
jgi:hypothetical protein